VGAGAVGGASAVHAPPAAIADRRELLDVDMDQLARPFALVALRRDLRHGRPIPTIKTAKPGRPEDRLDRGGGQADLEADPLGAPAVPLAEPHHPPPARPRGPVR
jgi:hypothetical protein